MQTPSSSAAEPIPPEAPASLLRGSLYTILAATLLTGAWLRFHDTIVTYYPFLGTQTAQTTSATQTTPATAATLQAFAELSLLPSGTDQAAVADLQLPPTDAAILAADLRRGRLHLLRVPLFDASASTPADSAGRVVEVSSGGYTRTLALARTPIVVTLPIDRAGTISFHTASPDGIGIGAVTLAGPVTLPSISPGQQMDVGVFVQ